ncbi:MAG: FtsW/RodA/SpoVE family cell cycle protein [Bacteroides sp.]|nr:FtsW/RodA/SpoVE family cell cycle protein [Bacteroides sp.]
MVKNKERIVIRETIDGRPVAASAAVAADAAPQESRIARARAEVGAVKSARPKADPYIWGIYLALLCISIVELFSASSSEVHGSNVYEPLIRHCIFLGIGFVGVLWLQNIHYVYFSRLASVLGVLSLGLLLLSTFFGADINGAQRAIKIAGFTIQPPEIVKLTVMIWIATILGRNQRPGGVSTKGVVYVSVIVVIFSGILWINGLTNTILMMMVSLAMFVIGGVPMKKLGAVLLIYCVAGGGIVMMKAMTPSSTEFDKAGNQTEVVSSTTIGRTDTHEGRLTRFFAGVSPTDSLTDMNRQVIFAKMAQANGGVLGRGPGNSRENARLPLAFSDYIYSIVVEDLGFVGGLVLLLLYLLLVMRAGAIAYKCSRAIPAFLIMGCAVLIVCQALVHMAIVTGVFPVSGQPLPFISKGGTSVLVMSVAIGIMLSVSRFAVTTKQKDKTINQAELDLLPEDMQAANYSNQEEHNQ